MNLYKKNNLKQVLILVAILIFANIISTFLFARFDLTHDKRYTLSQTSLNILKQVKQPLSIKIYMEGELPPEFRRLQQETLQILEEFQAYNNNISFEFVNPIEEDNENGDLTKDLFSKGLTPVNITIDDKGKQSQAIVFPWAIAVYNNKEVNIQLLKNKMGASTTQKVISSVQHLEYVIADAFNKITHQKQKKIAIIKGNEELPERYIAKFLIQMKESYFIGPFTLDSVAKNPIQTLNELQKYDLAIIAKPTERFTDEEKQTLDQFIINGGRSLWLIDQTVADMESLYNDTGSLLAYPRDLNLNDMFFKYGIRINPEIVKDEVGTTIKLATGEEGSATQFQEFNWRFAPQVFPVNNHPIVKNLGGIRFDFANAIDTLKNGIKKTVLLKSSPYSKKIGTPTEISLNNVDEITTPSDYFEKGNLPLALLLQGQFHSVYENRILPFEQKNFQTKSKNNKMIVISDGDLAKNQLDKNGYPVELGYDTKTGILYDNKDFMMNCVNYLLDDTGLINLRGKDLNLPLLDKEKVHENYFSIQLITIVLPIFVLTLFGIGFIYFRKRKYGKKYVDKKIT